MTTLWLMFTGAFAAATLLPGGSELLLAGFVQQEASQWALLVTVAAIGNTLGAITSYYVGVAGRFATSPEAAANGRYQVGLRVLNRYGIWTMLLAWVPIIGDVLCVLAGWLRLSFGPVVVLVFIGKVARYLLIAFMALEWF